MAERLQAAQIEAGRTAQLFARNDTKRGHWLGWSLGAIACACAVISLALGNAWVAGAFLSVPVLGVARALIESVKAYANKPSP
jgi:hypothetical protein